MLITLNNYAMEYAVKAARVVTKNQRNFFHQPRATNPTTQAAMI